MNVQLYMPAKIAEQPLYLQYFEMLKAGITANEDIHLTDKFPTLIHVFGAWNAKTAQHLIQAHRLLIPTVYSPLGELAPWWLHWQYTHMSLSKIYSQKISTQKANTVVAWGELEKQAIEQKKWNNQVKVVRNPIISNSITAEECIGKILKIYQHTIERHDEKIRKQIAERVDRIDKGHTLEHKFCELLLYVRYQYHRKNISSDSLKKLSISLLTVDYDEDLLKNMIFRLHEDKFTSHILQILSDDYELTEGFMPMNTLDDKETKKIKAVINKNATKYV